MTTHFQHLMIRLLNVSPLVVCPQPSQNTPARRLYLPSAPSLTLTFPCASQPIRERCVPTL